MLCLLVSCLSTSRRRLVFPILRMPDSENPILFLEESLRDKLGDEFLSSYEAASRRGGEDERQCRQSLQSMQSLTFAGFFGPAHASPSRVRYAYGTLGIPEGALSRFIDLPSPCGNGLKQG